MMGTIILFFTFMLGILCGVVLLILVQRAYGLDS